LKSLGYAHTQIGNLNAAADYYERAVALEPDNFELIISAAQSYDRMKDSGKAMFYAEKALEMRPDMADLYSYLGDLYNRNDRYSDAISMARQELEIRPNSAAAYCVWAKALEKQGNYQGAIGKFQLAVNTGDPAWKSYAEKEIVRQQKLIERDELIREQQELE